MGLHLVAWTAHPVLLADSCHLPVPGVEVVPVLAWPRQRVPGGKVFSVFKSGWRNLTCRWYQSLDQLPATRGQFFGVVFSAENLKFKKVILNYFYLLNQLGGIISWVSPYSSIWPSPDHKKIFNSLRFFLSFSPVNHPDCTIVILHCFVDPLTRLQRIQCVSC